MSTQDLRWAIILGVVLVVAGISGYPGFDLGSDDRLYLALGTLLVSMGLLLRRTSP